MSCRAGPAIRVASRRPPRTVPALLFCARDRGCTGVYRVNLDGRPETRATARLRRPGRLRAVGGRDRSGGGLRGRGPHRLWRDRRGGPHLRHPHHADQPHRHLAAGRCPGRSGGPHASPSPTARPCTASCSGPADTPTGPTPLLLDIHGGPHNAWSPVPDLGHGYQQLLVAAGWTVLTLNPRASDGYGEALLRRQRGQVGTWRPGGLPRPGRAN